MKSLGWALIQYDWCPNKNRKFEHTEKHQQCLCSEEALCENKVKRGSLASQGEKPQKEQNHATLWSWTSSLWNCEKINFCCLNYPEFVVFCYGSPSKLIQHLCTKWVLSAGLTHHTYKWWKLKAYMIFKGGPGTALFNHFPYPSCLKTAILSSDQVSILILLSI